MNDQTERLDAEQDGSRSLHRDVPAIDRRRFFKVLGEGILVLLIANGAFGQQETGGRRRRGGGGRGTPRPPEISAWLHIGEDGTVTVFTGKVEVGQNIRTSLTQAVAEELPTPLASIRLVMADTDLVPYDAGTFGSRTTPDMAVYLHRVAAAAREGLADLAAQHFQTEVENVIVEDGRVKRKDSTESVTFGQLTKGQKLTKTIEEGAPITAADRWKIAGSSVRKVDGAAFVTGQHQYASDLRRPGMLFGKVLRPPALGATLVSADTTAAEAMPGVTVVRDGDLVGVVAPDSLTAERALAAIKAEWNRKPQPSSPELFDLLKPEAPALQPTESGPELQRLQRRYTIAYIAHAPLEPRAAVAEWDGDKLTVWTGTQRPFGVRGDLAQAFSMGEDQIRVIAPDTGSAYGGKHSNAAPTEAAQLSRIAGKPVKLVWTREEEFHWAYFRPAGVIEISSAVRADGTLAEWEHDNFNSGGSAVRSPYDVPGQRAESHRSNSPLPQGSYRGLASTANVFAREMHMDELARLVKLDPLEFRLRNLKDDRLRAVLEAATKEFGWETRKPAEGRGFGIACGTEKNSFVAACAEVAVDREKETVKVVRAVVAFECGAVVNPLQLRNQVEGATVQGLGGALFEAIDFANGEITTNRFSLYRVPRFSDTPQINVVLVDRRDLPSSGAGETPIVGIAPAVGNAIFDASGLRLNRLPMVPNGLKG